MSEMKKIIFLTSILLIGSFYTISEASAVLPSDPLAAQWSYEAADVYRAWEYTGKSDEVVVAIIDNGFDYTHPDIATNSWVNKKEIPNNGIDDDRNRYIDDIYGWNFIDGNNDPLPNAEEIGDSSDSELIHHGTVVAGIIGAVGNNGRDGAGVAQKIKLMNLKVVDNIGSGLVKTVIEAIYYAVNNGAKVINMSMVGSGVEPDIKKAIQFAYEHGVTVVAAAGNDMADLNVSPDFPVCSDEGEPYTSVIGVSAIDQSKRLARFSNIGSRCIDITAPGVDIGGTLRYAPSQGLSESYSRGWNGTSFAAPFVSAGAAIIRGIQPSWNPDQITRTLFSTVHHTPTSDERGYRETYGKGLLQIGAAVEAAVVGKIPEARIFIEDDKDNSFTTPRRLLVSGNSNESFYEILGENKSVFKSIGMNDVQGLTSFRDTNGNAYYAVIKQKNKTEQYVSIYDYNWTRKYRWSFETRGRTYEIAAADIAGDLNKEIILAATNQGQEEIRTFYMDGTPIGDLNEDILHLGATITVGRNMVNEEEDVIYAYRGNPGTIIIKHFTKDIGWKKIIEHPLKSLGSISYLHDKGAKQEFIILGSGVGSAPLVTVLSREGELINSFRPYDLSFRGGVKVVSMIYGQGASERIVTVPKKGIFSLRIFDYTGNPYEDINIDSVLTKGKDVRVTVAPF